MPYSSIVVHVTPTSPAPSRVRLAAALADRLGAHLIGVAARPANLVAFNASSRVRLGAALADRLGAHLIGVAARPPNLVAFNDYGNLDDRLIKHELKLAGDEVGRAENVFKEATGACKATEWRSTIGWPTPFLIEQARAADLIVVAREDKSGRRSEMTEKMPGLTMSALICAATASPRQPIAATRTKTPQPRKFSRS
jgi:hypothetical protein